MGFVYGNKLLRENEEAEREVNIDVTINVPEISDDGEFEVEVKAEEEEKEAEVEPMEPTNEAFMNLVLENNMNYHAIIEAVGMVEVKYVQENGIEMIYEAEEKASLLSKFKAAFDMAIEKIKKLWDRIKAWFSSVFQDDDKFIKANEARILANGKGKGVKVKGYKFTPKFPEKLEAAVKKALPVSIGNLRITKADAEAIVADAQENAASYDLALQKVFCKTATDGQTFTKSLFAANRDGKLSPAEHTLTASDSISVLNDFKKKYKEAEAEMNKLNNTFKNLSNTAQDLIKRAAADEKAVIPAGFFTVYIQWINKVLNYSTMAFGAYAEALKDQHTQARKVCNVFARAAGPKEDKETVVESSIFTALESVKLI